VTVRRIDEVEMRRLFNEARILERVAAGELIEMCVKDTEVSLTFEPTGTRSQTVHYVQAKGMIKVASVHQYKRPDGSLGASGLPDPKYLVIDNVIYLLASNPKT
jgi:hypothetical protein